MPGVIQTRQGDNEGRGHRALKNDRGVIRIDTELPRAHGHRESYGVAYPRVAQTTGYGLNEPQWSEGPRPLIFQLSPYARVPLPPLSAYPITVHPLLTSHGEASVIWTIDQHPTTASCTPGLSARDQYHWKSLPAMDGPHIPSLTIQIHPFRTPIVVLPKNGVITVGDVLVAVYAGARRGATEIFCQDLHVSPHVMWTAAEDYNRLAVQHEGPTGGDDEVCTNVRSYMDFRTRWVGLEPSPTERDVWVLHTKPIAQR
ncbi:hypothetical protein BDZ97DRAFT_1920537 [Flammula alnicola]|nr:hypothetical protein BDZ97DRAFT_1920537 [Flammula alnicola]